MQPEGVFSGKSCTDFGPLWTLELQQKKGMLTFISPSIALFHAGVKDIT